MKRLVLASFCLLSAFRLAAQEVVIYGGTPGGIAAAIAAARLGSQVTLIEYHDHIGGMTASGLGKSDIENRAMIGGVFKEFVSKVREFSTRSRTELMTKTRSSATRGITPNQRSPKWCLSPCSRHYRRLRYLKVGG